MNKNYIAPKYYVYGCNQLLSDLRELVDSAADFEEQGKSAEEWLKYQGLKCRWEIKDIAQKGIDEKSNIRLSWGTAINMLILNRTNELLDIREEAKEDFPF